MYLGYHNIEIKTRGFLKLNFGIWNIVRLLDGFCVNAKKFCLFNRGIRTDAKLRLLTKIDLSGGVLDQEKDASLFLDETGLPAAQLRDSSRLKNIDTSFR